jgi:hypothetical protein
VILRNKNKEIISQSQREMLDTAKFNRLLSWFNRYTGERYSTGDKQGTYACFSGSASPIVTKLYFCKEDCFLIDPNYCSVDQLEISYKIGELRKYIQLDSLIAR